MIGYLEFQFIDGVVWGGLQYADGPRQYAVRKSLFYYQPDRLPPGYYRSDLNWTTWTSWNQEATEIVNRSYNYPHVAALHWAMYRVARNHVGLVTNRPWDWYLDKAYRTAVAMGVHAGRYAQFGQMEGTVFLEERIGLSSRGYYNKAGIRIWKAHPVLGVGIGNYGHYFIQPEFNPGLKASNRLPPHNIYIQALAEMGLVGFLVLCWWILQTAYNYWVAERKGDEDPDGRIYLRLCEALTLFTLTASFTSGNLMRTPLAMVIALSAVCRRCAEKGVSDPAVAAGGVREPVES